MLNKYKTFNKVDQGINYDYQIIISVLTDFFNNEFLVNRF